MNDPAGMTVVNFGRVNSTIPPHWPGYGSLTTQSGVIRILTVPICPDLLDYEALGESDNLRGRVVRAFFWLMRAWPA